MAQHTLHSPSFPSEDGNSNTLPPQGAPPEFAEERHFIDYLRVLSKRRWTAIPVFLAVVIVLLIPTFTATPLYEASGQLLIEADTQNVVTFKAVVEQDAATLEFYQTHTRFSRVARSPEPRLRRSSSGPIRNLVVRHQGRSRLTIGRLSSERWHLQSEPCTDR